MSKISSRTFSQNFGLWLGLFLFLGVLVLFNPAPDNPQVGRMAAVVILMAVWWIAEAIPLAATSLLPVVLLPLLGIQSADVTSKAYINMIIFLYIGGFLIALAMERWRLHRRIALSIINKIGSRPDKIILGFMIASAFLSMWISNTATAVMMLPIGLAIIEKMEEAFGKKAHKISVILLLAIAYSCSIGGVATLVGTPTNLAFVRIYAQSFPQATPISFGQWFVIGLPISIIMILAGWLLLTRILVHIDKTLAMDRQIVKKELEHLGPMTYEEKIVTAVGCVTAFLWIFRSDLVMGSFTLPGWSNLWKGFASIHDGTVGVFMALLLFVIPAGKKSPHKSILENNAFHDLPWAAVLLFGGGFAMASGFSSSGLTQFLATQFASWGNLTVFTTIIIGCLAVTLMSELVSNVATVQMLLPILAAWAAALEIDPLKVMIPATLVASMAFLMPVATPPNAVIFGSQRLKVSEMIRYGIPFKVAAFIIVLLLSILLLPVFLIN